MEQQTPGEEGRRCPYCPRTFPFPSYLQRHITMHTGEKPFRCPRCGQRYTRRNYLREHIRRKHLSELPAEPALQPRPAPAHYLYPSLSQPTPMSHPPPAASPPETIPHHGTGGQGTTFSLTPLHTLLESDEEAS